MDFWFCQLSEEQESDVQFGYAKSCPYAHVRSVFIRTVSEREQYFFSVAFMRSFFCWENAMNSFRFWFLY